MLKLDLGSSDDRRPGYLSVDIAGDVDVRADLNQPWPWEDSSVDEVRAYDVFEHLWPVYMFRSTLTGLPMDFTIRRADITGKIWAMNEAHRVLKPGGILDLAIPSVLMADGKSGNPGAYADPTHATFWVFDDRYFYNEEWNTPDGERGRLGPGYGITALFRGAWRLVEYGAGPEKRAKIYARLEAVK